MIIRKPVRSIAPPLQLADLSKPKLSAAFTLVELLVGMFLSLFIGGMALTFMMSSSQSFQVQTNDAVSNENARFVLEQMSQYIRLAGWDEDLSPGAERLEVISNQALCPADESAISVGDNSPCTVDGLAGASDRFAVDFAISNSFGATSTVTLCNGRTVTAPLTGRLELAHVFWTADLDLPADGVRSLYCQPLNITARAPIGAAVPLVDGIDRLEVQYGVDTSANGNDRERDEIIDQYQSFSNLIAGSASPQKISDRTRSVRAIRFAVLVNAGLFDNGDANIEQVSDKQYQLLDGPTVTFLNDRVFRQVYSTTALVHNSLRRS